MTTQTAPIMAATMPAPQNPNITPIGANPAAATLQLLSCIAHELRTPLAALTASSEMLGYAEGDDRVRFTAIIQRQTQRLNMIVEGLLAAYGASQGTFRRVRDVIDMSALLRELCDEQALLFPHHRIVMDVEPGRRVSADRRLLEMVLLNLVSNACKYSPQASTVSIECKSERDAMRISVRDEGPGIPAHLRDRIFNAGERGAMTDDSGCGLGLYIAQSLCDAMGAELTLDDSDDVSGACFVVLVPDQGLKDEQNG